MDMSLSPVYQSELASPRSVMRMMNRVEDERHKNVTACFAPKNKPGIDVDSGFRHSGAPYPF